jgi:myo-inositol-1(or 4)-monophosphatase
MAIIEPGALLELATSLATRAGALVAEASGRTRTEVATKSSATDMVTEMDRASEALILGELARSRPGDSILAEEAGSRAGTSPIRWLIDPLDGTTNYLYGLPAYAVSIAAESTHGPLLGVVHDASRGETFTALAGQGAWLNGVPLHRAPAPTLDRCLIGTGFGYSSDRRLAQAKLLPTVLSSVRDIRRVGSAAIDLCWVAAGRLDGFYEAGLAPWDLAAGMLVAREAGAWVGSVPGGAELPDMAVAAAPGLSGPLTALLEEARDDACTG